MDQQNIGRFLRTLRMERGLTQAQLAERLGVTNRSVSRWETGVNLPDLDLLLELSDCFDVTIEEFLQGKRSEEAMDEKTKALLLQAADYENRDKTRMTRRLFFLDLAAIAAFLLYAALDILGLASGGVGEDVASFALGLVFGMLLVVALYTSRYGARVRAAKRRLLRRLAPMSQNSEQKE